MKKYLFTAALILGLTGAGAMAQSTTPGVPSPHDPDTYPEPQATTPDRQDNSTWESDHDRTSTDQQEYPDARHDRDPNDQYNNGQYDTDRQDRTPGDHDRDRVSGTGGYRDQIQSALQEANLRGVTVSDTGSRIELSGTVPTGHDRRQALGIAQSFAQGRQVVDNLQVTGNGGHDHNDPH